MLTFLKQDLRHDLMQSLAKGIYVAQYQIYAGICTIKNKMTSNLLPSTMAENRVPSNPPTKMMLVTLRYLSAMFLS